MAVAKKSKTVAVTGVIERCEMKNRAPFRPDYYGVTAEKKEFYIDVCLRLSDGSAVYFNTPAVTRRIGAPPGAGCAVVTFNFRNPENSNEWMEEYIVDGGPKNAVALPGKPNNNDIRSKVKVGDTLTIAGRVKAEKVGRGGTKYKTLTHVFVPTAEGLANFPAEDKFGF